MLGAVGAEVVGPSGLVVRLAPVADVAAGFEGALGPVADAETESIRVLLEQALTIDAKPTLPANRSNWRRLTESGRTSGRSRPGASMGSRYGRKSSWAKRLTAQKVRGAASPEALCFTAQCRGSEGVIVADELKVDPVALHLGSNQMLNAVGEASLEFVSHEDGLAGAASGWIGSSQLALGELAARWEVRHNHHKLQVGGLGSHVADAMVSYVTTEDGSVQAVRSLQA